MRLSGFRRGVLRHSPRFVARPIARRQARKIEARYFRVPLHVTYHDAGMQALQALLALR
jgi:hypothetical protein